jgi:hypothetical protein
VSRLQRYVAMRSPLTRPSSEPVLFWTLCYLWVLNAADLALTSYGIWLGFASEGNGVMRYFLHQGTAPAAGFKIGIVTVGALLLWRLRRYRTTLVAAVTLTGVLAAVVTYQAFWLASL